MEMYSQHMQQSKHIYFYLIVKSVELFSTLLKKYHVNIITREHNFVIPIIITGADINFDIHEAELYLSFLHLRSKMLYKSTIVYYPYTCSNELKE